ncbi:MAG: CsgG/HfaB family protein [Burkholderiaceae bacterium]
MNEVLDHRRGRRLGGRLARISAVALGAAGLSGCLAGLGPVTGGGSTSQAVSGSAAGTSTQDATASLERCPETLGTLFIDEDTNASWYRGYRSRYGSLGSTVPVLRVLIQQSNCFVIVARGKSYSKTRSEIDTIGRGGEARAGSSVQKGQVVVADYMLQPEVTLSAQGTSGLGGGLFGRGGGILNAIAGSVRSNESSTTLTLVDNRSTVQIASAVGYAKNFDIGLAGGLFSGGGGGGLGAYTRTPEGKTILAAFVDSYNNMVRSVREYKAQTVQGGLGRGGRLGVQGGQTEASKSIPSR